MGWCETRGRGGAMGIERAGGSVSATRNAHDCELQRGLCDRAHVSVMVVMAMTMKPEVLMVTMMMAIVMVIAARPAIGVEHS